MENYYYLCFRANALHLTLVSGCWLCPLRSISANASACFSLHLRSARSGSGRLRTKGDVNGAARHRAVLRYIAKRHKVSAKIDTLHNASVCKQPPNATSQTALLTKQTQFICLFVFCLFTPFPREYTVSRGVPEFKRLGSLPRKSQTKNAQPNRLCVFVGGR